MFTVKKAFNVVLAIGYGVYLAINSSKEEMQAIKTENALKRQKQVLQDIPEKKKVAPKVEVNQVVEVATNHQSDISKTIAVVEDVWKAPLQTTKKSQWTTIGQVHTVTPQLLLAPAPVPKIVDYSNWTVKQLKAEIEAKKGKIKGLSTLRKAQLIEKLTA